ncbi:hypothetical protein HIM_04407 [Hirsutella minnesotensis 3608]|uniref:Granulins domain-containing protein n=1 Tax=Hirsutella minnesotensis 3608 TaxID=1043627 RepID=A0A0F7ZPY8_9HYPO|nr:hypothetical protein HIM_04407 [Hirsutella minnesotensis 3608]
MNLMLLAAACLVGLRAASQATYGIPIVTWPPLLEPRYFAEASFAVAKRDGQCDKGSHNCLDVNHDGQCCENDTYCYIDKTNALRCCPIGSNCVDNSPCKSDSFFCRRTVDTNLAGTALATPTLQDGCCQRLCPQTSHYLCARSLGGKCCPYGAECQDYFGPSPVTGPYTDTALSSEHVSPGLERAVPPQPRTPGDIAAPVEMDSSAAASRGSRLDEMVSAPQTSNTVEGRFELYGSQPETPIVQSTSQAHMQSPPEIPRDRVSP